VGDNRQGRFLSGDGLFTSNLGAAEMSSLLNPRLGFHAPALDDTGSNANSPTDFGGRRRAARRKFTPEFINRLDNIVVFKIPGTEELRDRSVSSLSMVQQRIQAAAEAKRS